MLRNLELRDLVIRAYLGLQWMQPEMSLMPLQMMSMLEKGNLDITYCTNVMSLIWSAYSQIFVGQVRKYLDMDVLQDLATQLLPQLGVTKYATNHGVEID